MGAAAVGCIKHLGQSAQDMWAQGFRNGLTKYASYIYLRIRKLACLTCVTASVGLMVQFCNRACSLFVLDPPVWQRVFGH